MKLKFLLTSILSFTLLVGVAQNKTSIKGPNVKTKTISSPFYGEKIVATDRGCATMENLEIEMKNDPQLAQRMQNVEKDIQDYIKNNPQNKSGVAVTIPVVFHVVYKNADENLSAGRIQDQLDVLNEDFRKLNADAIKIPAVFQSLAADIEVNFCLATKDPLGNATTGITRTSTNLANFPTGSAVKTIGGGGQDPWPSAKYLNIWVCDIAGSVLGFATFPGGSPAADGIVLDFAYTGTDGSVSPYNLGRTATHEVGHYLGLKHIWGDANCGDDDVFDTPTQAGSNGGCPIFPKVSACTGNAPNGDLFMNYMDYSDDRCLYMFTNDQKTRMLAALNSQRAGLLTSNVCSTVVVVPGPGCDTLELNNFISNYNAALYYVPIAGQNGYISGNNSFLDKAKAEKISQFTSSAKIKGAFFYFVIADAGNINDEITVKAWDDNGTSGAPGTILGSKKVKISSFQNDVINSELTYVEFPILVPVNGPFYLGFDLIYNFFDSVAVATTDINDLGVGQGTAWEQLANGNWFPYSDPTNSWGYELKHYIFPIMCTTVGIDNVLESTNISVFPNPANDRINILIGKEVKKSEMSVYNMLGQLVKPNSINKAGNQSFSADIANLNSGIYFIHINTDLGNVIQKIIKE